MFDKWVNQDIGNVLARRKRVVVGAEASLLDLLGKVLPKEMTIFVVHGGLEELECKYTVEKFHKDEKVVIIATAPKTELTFIRDYAETCGYVDIRNVESYVVERVFQELGLNISLTLEELKVAAYNSLGKGREYTQQLMRSCTEGALFFLGLQYSDKARSARFGAGRFMEQRVAYSRRWIGLYRLDTGYESLQQLIFPLTS